MKRLLGFAASLVFGAAACDSGPHVEAQAYKTHGTGRIRTCTGAGIEMCNYESADVPQFIDAHDSKWTGVRAEWKSEDYTMCYLNLPGGFFSERLLMFRCEPLDQQVSMSTSFNSERLKTKILKNLESLASASAAFEICASDRQIADEQAIEWISYSIDLARIAEDISTHFRDNLLYLSFELARFKIGEDTNFRSEMLDQAGGCAAASLLNAARYVSETREVAAFYLTLPHTSLREEAAQPGASPDSPAAARPPGS